MGKKTGDYFLGLDIGTNSVGWAVTNYNYELLKAKGHKMWGSRLFEEGQVAASRRAFRTARRRLMRRRDRLDILEDLFKYEIAKVDSTFFLRLKESKYHFEDKTTKEKYGLFNDKDYTDKEFFEEYPTIYHLRAALMKRPAKDIRELFLAIHHIMKYRGHFLFEGEQFETGASAADSLSLALSYLELVTTEPVKDLFGLLLDKSQTRSDRAKRFSEKFDSRTKKQAEALAKVALGLDVTTATLFDNEEYKELENAKKVNFSDGKYVDEHEKYEIDLNEDVEILDLLKQVYDSIILSTIKEEGLSLSASKVKQYKKHEEDLKHLKEVLKPHRDLYFQVLKEDKKGVPNYVQYIKKGTNDGSKSACTKEDFYAFLKKILEKMEPTAAILSILKEIELNSYLPLLRMKDNGSIPYQLHLEELEAILNQSVSKYAFLTEMSDGLSTKEKLVQLFKFRIPYYVGPLNPAHASNEDKQRKGHAWVVRKEAGKVYPWNFEDKIDVSASATAFITRMTNKCTYLIGKDVIPKNSLLYSEYMLLNELNNLKYNGNSLTPEIKEKLIEAYFHKENRKLTIGRIREFLKCEGYCDGMGEVTGIDQSVKADLKSYRDMLRIFGPGFDHQMAEQLILWITLFGDASNILKSNIEKKYGTNFLDKYWGSLKKLRYKDWGNFSREFLTEIIGMSEIGESNIITALRKTSLNLMELLKTPATFIEAIEDYNAGKKLVVDSLSYDMVDALAIPPSVKRSVWQAMKIVQEIIEIRGSVPAKIFVEVARTNRAEKVKKDSRQAQLLGLYSAISDDSRDWKKEIQSKESSLFRSKKLYLYYTQMGKCMYSGESIDIESLFTDLYDIDHIYPRSVTKDDSFDNLVLVKKECNANKSDNYPIKPHIQEARKGLWTFLAQKDLISQKKYERLVRKTELSPDELASFISRQLVETNQSVKATISLLKQLCPDTEVVFSKAENVSDFRRTNEFIKVRSINHHHHAQDAYLNIVVGNVYLSKFTKHPANFILDKKTSENARRFYNLNKMYEKDVSSKEGMAWDTKTSLDTVKAMMNNHDVRVTKKVQEQKGELYDATVYKANQTKVDAYAAMKPNDSILGDVTKYGGRTKIKNAYYTIYQVETKGALEVRLLAIPITVARNLKTDEEYINYGKTQLGNVTKVLFRRLCLGTVVKIDGYYYYIGGKTNSNICIDSAAQLILEEKYQKYVKEIEKCLLSNIPLTEAITSEKNISILQELIRKLEARFYMNMKGNKVGDIREKGIAIFSELDLGEQCKVIMDVLNMLTQQKGLHNIDGIGLKSSRATQSMSLQKVKEFVIITESVTGLYRREIKII